MIHYPKLIQIILNLTEIEALPKYIRNKSSEIQNLFSAEIPALVGPSVGGSPENFDRFDWLSNSQ